LSVAVLLVVATLSVSAVISYSVATAAAEHLLAVREKASQWLGTLLDAETGVRDYPATDKSLFLEPYLSAVGQERVRAAAFETLIVEDRPAFHHMETAEKDAQAVMNHLAMLTDLARSGRREEALRYLATGKGKVLMDIFRRDLVAFGAIESRLSADQKGSRHLRAPL
jgi:CHASE3 domain sensor protein